MNIVSLAQREFRQIYPQPGWVEHDPFDILGTQLETMREVVARGGIDVQDIAAAAIANQRKTVVVWDKKNRTSLMQRNCMAMNAAKYGCLRKDILGREISICGTGHGTG